MLWIKEVELVDSVDDLKSSSSLRGIQMPKVEVLDARIASALNKIIHNTQFKRKVSLEEQEAQKQYRVLRGRQIAYLIYEYFRVTGIFTYLPFYFNLSFTVFFHSSVLMHPDLHTDLDNLDSVENNLPPLRQGEQRHLRRHRLPHRL